MLFIWILIGTTIGVMAHMVDTPFDRKSMLTSVSLGIVGACIGGLMSQTLLQTGTTSVFASPLLYITSGALLSAMIPNKGNIL